MTKGKIKRKMPYVICHMVISQDGKVTGDFLRTPEGTAAAELYYELHRQYGADAFACGRVTMEESFTGGWYPDLQPFERAVVNRADYIADAEAPFYAVAFDRQGRLGWKDAHIHDEDPGYDNAHIIEVLCENVSDAYLAYLRNMGVSYIFAGETVLDLHLALAKLYKEFGIKTLLLEGGSILNGAFHEVGFVDELSLVMAPVKADTEDKPLFYGCDPVEYVRTYIQNFDERATWIKGKRKSMNVE